MAWLSGFLLLGFRLWPSGFVRPPATRSKFAPFDRAYFSLVAGGGSKTHGEINLTLTLVHTIVLNFEVLCKSYHGFLVPFLPVYGL